MVKHGRVAGLCLRTARPRPLRRCCLRSYSTEPNRPLKEVVRELIPGRRERLKKLRTEYGSRVIGDIKVENVLGGMRGLKAMIWEGSVLDAEEGIRFQGRTINECQATLPKGRSGSVMLPEAMFWLLMTGKVPSTTQIRRFSRELARAAPLPTFVDQMLDQLPLTLHPMTQFAMAVAALNERSAFAKAYELGLSKYKHWESTFDDCISLVAKLPTIAAKIYQNTYAGGGPLPGAIDDRDDWAGNFATMLGKPAGPRNEGFRDLLRLYLALHSDHEGGNVSAHATHLVGSALSDPFLSYSAGLLGLAGPLHGLAAQEVLRFLVTMQSALGPHASDGQLQAYLEQHLASGLVIPGYGHAVLRKPDPRFDALLTFGQQQAGLASGDNALFTLVQRLAALAPGVLRAHGKTQNPHPNVDAVTAVLFHHFGLTQPLYYTVTFAVSRGLGPLAQLVWDRALGLPIERPKSVNLKGLLKMVEPPRGGGGGP
ncbi:MAG: hypothetical protein M1826_004190 [Phylliscum demangeonii]|nr:MAG: hypothetical protein M1826_004190 [Phylliscum demangeonii]